MASDVATRSARRPVRREQERKADVRGARLRDRSSGRCTGVRPARAHVPPVLLGLLRGIGVLSSVALLTLGAISTPLAAPTRPEPSAAQKETARTLMDTGRTKERRRDFEGALDAYVAADKIMGVPSTGLSVGKMYAKLGKLVEARDAFLRVARFPVEPGEPRPYALARREAERLEAALAPRIPSLRILVRNDPPPEGLSASVDGVAVPAEALAFPIKVNPGQLAVIVSARRFLSVERSVDIEERATAEIAVTLELDPAVLEEERAAAAAAASPADEEPSEGGVSPLAWAGFGVGGALILVGVVTGAVAVSKASELDEACPDQHCPPDRESDIDSLQALSHTSTVTLVLGSAVAVGGLIALFALSDDEPAAVDDSGESTDEPLEPEVDVAVGIGSLGIVGRF